MKIPNELSIGSIQYEVQRVPGLRTDTKILYGLVDWDNSIIQLNSENQSHQHMCVCLLHEVLHGIIQQRSLKVENEEEIVESLAYGLYDFLQNNVGGLYENTNA